MLKWLLKFVVMFGFLASALQAQTRNMRPEVRVLAELSLFAKEYEKPEARDQLVRALNSYCIALDKAFPKNSPAEEAWISGEFASKDSTRILRVVDSPEWGRRMASEFTESCLSLTGNFFSNPDQRIVSLFALIQAVARFHGDAATYARKNKLDPDNWGFIILGSSIEALGRAGVWESGKVYRLDTR